MERRSSAYYQRRHRERLREQGLIKKELWVLSEYADELAEIERRMRQQALGIRDITEVPEGLSAVTDAVVALLEKLEGALGPAPDKIVLGGFSQGAMLALNVALRSPRPLAGLVLLSGTHIAANEWAPLFQARAHGAAPLAVFQSHGREDPVLPFAVSEGLRETMSAAGIPVEWVPFPGGHGIPQGVLAGVSTFLKRVLA